MRQFGGSYLKVAVPSFFAGIILALYFDQGLGELISKGRKWGADGILAIDGGSVIDSAKAISAGSPQAQQIMIARQGNISFKKELAKKISGIK